MKHLPNYRLAGRLWLGLVAAVSPLVPLASAPEAPTAPGTVVVAGAFHLLVPAGWQAVTAGEAGVVLRPPPGAVAPIEAVVWPVPAGGEASPAAAAAAQETALFRLNPYVRLSQRAFAADDGRLGLLVIGQVRASDGQLRESVFVAYATLRQFAVVGTFGAAGQADRLVSQEFGAVARSLTPLVEPTAVALPPALPAPPLAPPLSPVLAAPAPAIPEPQPGAGAPVSGKSSPATPAVLSPPLGPLPRPSTPAVPTPAAPAPPEQRAGGSQVYTSPLGFRVEVPAGWEVQVNAGRIEVAPAPTAGLDPPSPMVFIWPWALVADSRDPIVLGQRILESWEVVGGATAGLATRQEGRTAYFGGTVGRGLAPRRLVACCTVGTDTAVVAGFLGRAADFAAQVPVVARILSSFSGGPWWAVPPPSPGTRASLWTDPDFGVLQVPTPPGWKLHGKLARFNGLWTIALEGANGDRKLRVGWYQPVLPLFRDLTPVLANLGWQEGDRYQGAPGDPTLRVMPRLQPADFLAKVWLTQGPGRLAESVIERVEAAPAAASLTPGNGTTGMLARLRGTGSNGPCQRLVLAAVADAPEVVGPNTWQAAILECEAPAGALDQAVEALQAMVRGAELRPGNSQVTGATVLDLVRRARLAVGAWPSGGAEVEGMFAVLTRLAPTGQGAPWLMPALALEPWHRVRMQADGQQPVGETLPEVGPGFWR